MKSYFLLFLLTFLAGMGYTCWRFWTLVPLGTAGKAVVTALYVGCFVLFFLVRRAGTHLGVQVAGVAYTLGTSWMIFAFYALLLFLLLDLGRLLHLVPGSLLKDSLAGTLLVFGTLALLLTCGGIHYHHKYRQELVVRTDKPLERPLTVVLASDLHVGYGNRRGELARWVDLINAEQPDLVLFCGDVLDGDIRPARHDRCEEEFRRIGAPVYGVLGNHEYYTGADASCAFYADAGIRLLRDESAVAEGIRIIGRDDRTRKDRQPLDALVPADSLFTLLLDHQPQHLEEAERCGIDFQFSGHTHHGQVWPLSLVTDRLYEKAFGPCRRSATDYYVSSGLGIWGGRFRIGTRSEYLVLKITNR